MATISNHSIGVNVALVGWGKARARNMASASARPREGRSGATSRASTSCPSLPSALVQSSAVPKRAATHNIAFERSQPQRRVRSVGRRSTRR
jgi:hypothetical protein